MNVRYQVIVNGWGEYQIQYSYNGDKFKDCYEKYKGDDSHCYMFLWMAKIAIYFKMREDKRRIKAAVNVGKIVYGPRPKSKGSHC